MDAGEEAFTERLQSKRLVDFGLGIQLAEGIFDQVLAGVRVTSNPDCVLLNVGWCIGRNRVEFEGITAQVLVGRIDLRS